MFKFCKFLSFTCFVSGMKVSPKYAELYGAIPQNARIAAKKPVTNPVTAGITTAAASAIAAAVLIQPEITIKGIENNLIKNGYKKDEQGNLKKTLTEEQIKNLEDKWGYPHKNYVKLTEQPLKPADLQEFKDFVDIGKEKGKNLYKNNFNNLFTAFLIMRNNRMINQFRENCITNKDYYKYLENAVNTDVMENLGVVSDYKADCSSALNTYLRLQANDTFYKMDDTSKRDINRLSDFISTQTVPESIKLYRGEGYEVLNNVQLDSGKTINLGQMMKEAATFNDENLINEIKELVLDNEITAIQPGFMSLSLNKDTSEAFSVNRISWELTPEKDTKGAYVDSLNIVGLFATENEVLLQKNSKITIDSIDYDNEKCIWRLKGRVSN